MAPRLAIAMLLAALLVAACGSSSPASSSSSTGSGATSTGSGETSTGGRTTATSASPATSSATSTGSSSAVSSSSTTTAATSSRPPEVPRTKQRHVPHLRPVAPNTSVRIPASFTIAPGSGKLIPPLISVPKGITVNLRVRNADSRTHTVHFAAPGGYTVRLAAGKTSSTQVSGLPDATYRLLIDGSSKGRIVVGSVPGP